MVNWVVAVNGADLESLNVLEYVDYIQHIDSIEAFDSLKIVFSVPDGGGTLLPSKFMIGADVQLFVDEDEKFLGKVKGWAPDFGAKTIEIHCYDYSLTMRGKEKSRSFQNMTIGQIINRIAGGYPKIKRMDVDDPDFKPRGQIAQSNECDRDFLLKLATYCDRLFWISKDTLHFKSLASLEFDDKILILNPTSDQTDKGQYELLSSFTPRINIIDVESAIEVRSEDPYLRDNIKGLSPSSLARDGDTLGADLVIDVCGERKRIILDRAPKDEREAIKIAKAHFNKRADNFVTGTGELALGNPKLGAGSKRQVLLQGLPKFDAVLSGMYKIKEVVHVLSDYNIDTSFSFGRNAINEES